LKYLFATHLRDVCPYEKELGEDVRPYALYPKVPLLLLLGNETPGAYTYIPPFHFEDIIAAKLKLLEAKRSDEVAFLTAERCNKASRAAAQMPAVETWLEHDARIAKLYPSGTFCEYSVKTEDGYSVARFADHCDFSTYAGQCELAGDLKPWASHSACSMHSIYKDRSFERFEQRGCVAQPWLGETRKEDPSELSQDFAGDVYGTRVIDLPCLGHQKQTCDQFKEHLEKLKHDGSISAGALHKVIHPAICPRSTGLLLTVLIH
jgi:hypothetical protein